MLLKRLIISIGLSLFIGSITGYIFAYKRCFCVDRNYDFKETPISWFEPEDCISKTYFHTSNALAFGVLTLGISLIVTGVMHKEVRCLVLIINFKVVLIFFRRFTIFFTTE
jgi:hypothetical protein